MLSFLDMHATAADGLPVADPRRTKKRMRLRASLRSAWQIVKDPADPIAKSQLSTSTVRARFYRQAEKFVQSDFVQEMLKEEWNLTAVLDNSTRWSNCGPQTVAAQYHAFMKRQNSNAAELVSLSAKWRGNDNLYPDLIEWYKERSYATHDLYHVLCGYDFDVIGELCLLAWIQPHFPSAGMDVIMHYGVYRVAKGEGDQKHVKAAIAEAWRNSRKVAPLWEQSITGLMEMDLAEARTSLGIRDPEHYKSTLV